MNRHDQPEGSETEQRRTPTNSRGFTLVEIMIAVAIVSFLVVVAVPVLGGRSDAVKAGSAREFLVETLPKAMVGFSEAAGPAATLSQANQLNEYGASTESAWGGSWQIVGSARAANSHLIKYPIGGERAATIGGDMAKFLTGNNSAGQPRFRFIQSASYGSGYITVRYSPLINLP